MTRPGALSRRALLERAPLLAGAAALPALASACKPASHEEGAALAAPPAAFLEAAKAATGGLAVDAALAARLYADLAAHHPDLDGKITQLTAALRALGGKGAQIAQQPALAALFADLMGGLYLGVVGPQAARRCVGFETIESYQLFDGVLAPPSYAGGAPGSWASPAAALPATATKPTGEA